MFSVMRDVRLELPAGREEGRGRLEAVPGTPPELEGPLASSVRWDVTMTEWDGSKLSELSSPPEKSQSTEMPARNFSGPSSASRVELTLVSKSASTLWR